MINSYKEFLIFLLMVHVLGNFYFESESMASKKEKKFRWVAIHSFIYGLLCFILVKSIISNFSNTYLFILTVSHFIIDTIKFYWMKSKFFVKWKNYVLIIDQIVHLIILMTISFFIMKTGIIYEYSYAVQEVFNIMGLSIETVVLIFLKVLLIHKPINIFILSIMKAYKPSDKNETGTIRAGRAIGTVERVIMLFFLSIQRKRIIQHNLYKLVNYEIL